MHVIQHGHVVTFPDDAPVPTGSVPIDPPEEYGERPELYVVKSGRLVRRPAAEVAALTREDPALKLTQEEIGVLKEAIAAGTISAKPKPKPAARPRKSATPRQAS